MTHSDKAPTAERATPKLRAQPEHCPGGYVMHFYCKYENPDHPQQYPYRGAFMEEADQVETRGQAISQMRRSGWMIHRDNTATCPTCRAALRALSQSHSQTERGEA